jgi:predicted type IV restriction endonuclease
MGRRRLSRLPPQTDDSGIVTTETELEVFDYVRTRLSFLVGDEELFEKLSQVQWVDRKTLFTVFYKQERKGGFSISGKAAHQFTGSISDRQIETDNLREIDDALLSTFRQRVKELG